ncbi:hypothetical protein VP01_6211g1 [Puccinia sorghi]|uniref:Uncharacterized protein n=1 Tax=Puccinia sorghi TaxID=27349 RepID=A0A0L6UGK1_9BASI|nr:hypothetical protein VP01_6211g1 [Puccinia sorghi]
MSPTNWLTTFERHQESLSSGDWITIYYSQVVVKINFNHGSPDLTWIYQIQIHGETVNRIDGLESFPKELDYVFPT